MRKAKEVKATPEGCGFCVYIGPTLIGYIQEGQIFGCEKAEALESLAYQLRKYPEIAALVVPGDDLQRDRKNAKTPGNYLYEQYRKLLGRKGR